MKHGNFKASRAADMYFNNNKKTKQKKKRNLKSVLKLQLSDGGFILGFRSREEAEIKTETF